MSLPEAGLNDDTLTSIQSTDDFITPPDVTPAGKPPITVVADDVPADSDTDALIQTLSNYDVTLKTIEDDVAVYHELDTVAKVVLSSESIDQTDAARVIAILPSVEDDVAPVSHFTEQPSKTHLAAVQSTVETALKERVTDLIKRTKSFVEQEMETARTLHTSIFESSGRHAVSLLESACVEASRDFERFRDTKNLMFYHKDRNPVVLIDIRNRIIGRFTSDKDLVNAPNTLPSDDRYRMFAAAVDSDVMCAFVDASRSRNTESQLLTRLQQSLQSSCTSERLAKFNLLDLLWYFLSKQGLNYYQALLEEHDACYQETLKLVESNPGQSWENENATLGAYELLLAKTHCLVSDSAVLQQITSGITAMVRHSLYLFACYRSSL